MPLKVSGFFISKPRKPRPLVVNELAHEAEAKRLLHNSQLAVKLRRYHGLCPWSFITMMNSNDQKVYLTQEGLEKLKKELEALANVRKPAAVERVASTRVPGELVENNDYNQAKQDLAFIEGRISELEDVLAKAEVIERDHSGSHTQVGLGCKVTVEVNGQEGIFHLVGEWEADPTEQKISHESPLGKALLGKKVGEQVEVEAPVGRLVYTVIAIE